MKIQIEIDDSLTEEVVVIRCRRFDDTIAKIQSAVEETAIRGRGLVFYKGNTEYYLPLEMILFFETEGSSVSAHTADDVFLTRYKLYELEELLPGHFMRISKSAIVNTEHIYSINRNISASSAIEFNHTHKQIYVSRNYYKALKEKLEEKRMRL